MQTLFAMAGSSTKISFPQLTEKHDCDHAASATIVIILLTSARSQPLARSRNAMRETQDAIVPLNFPHSNVAASLRYRNISALLRACLAQWAHN